LGQKAKVKVASQDYQVQNKLFTIKRIYIHLYSPIYMVAEIRKIATTTERKKERKKERNA